MLYSVNRRSRRLAAKTSTITRLLLYVSLMIVCYGAAMGPWAQTNSAQTSGGGKSEENGFRISHTSDAGPDRDAEFPDVAYNPDDNEYLVVWDGDGRLGPDLRQVKEIFGQRINAATGAVMGLDFRISNMSESANNRNAIAPRVVYNSTAHEYLVVWNGRGYGDAPDATFEVYGQRLSRAGKEVGSDFRISNTTDLGKVADTIVRASTHPSVAYNSAADQYLVVWSGMGQPEDVPKSEVYGQLLTSAGVAVGKNFRLSSTSDQGVNFNANTPDVAYNSTNNQYLVVWSGGFKEAGKTEIWGQALNAQGASIGQGNGDFLISQITALGGNRSAAAPRLAYNKSSNEYLVVFQANGVPDRSSAYEIFGQRINAATLAELAPDDFRISQTVGPKDSADNPRVAYNAVAKEYLVVWRSVRTDAPFEIFGQRISPTGSEIDADFQISHIAALGNERRVNTAATVAGGASGEYLTVWQGDALPGPTNKKVNEIFGLRIKPSQKR